MTVGILAGSILLTGCIGGNVPQVPTGTEGESSSGSTAAGWCDTGSYWNYAGPEGEQVQAEVVGIAENYDLQGGGTKNMCEAVWTSNEEPGIEYHYFFSEDGESVCWEMRNTTSGESDKFCTGGSIPY